MTAVDSYQASFDETWSPDSPVRAVRFVVLDTETTGLDPRRDRIITIGAVAVVNGEILIEDSFEALVKIAFNDSSITVHGITRDESQQGGMEERDALLGFLEYLRDGVIVGHHIGHDVETIGYACERNFGFRLRNQFLDTMALTLHLEDDGAFTGMETAKGFSLDALCDMFGVIPHDRHTAGGDAFITAQIFLRLLRAARLVGRTTLSSIAEPYATG